jgi:hypothetical protein
MTHYPVTMGPRTGPRKTLAVKRLVAGPRPTAGQISAITPKSCIQDVIDTIGKRKNTSRIRNRSGCEKSGQEARNEQCFDVMRECLPNDEKRVGGHRHDEDRFPSNELTSRTPK